MKLFGLIGKNISYSFSRAFFSEKFKNQGLDYKYQNFDLTTIKEFPRIFELQNISGLNVTIPYKEAVIPYLDVLDPEAKAIGAVNTIQIKDNKLIGCNTDHYGFKNSLIPHLKPTHKKALILGTGGASKAVFFALESLGFEVKFVSRSDSSKNILNYEDLSESYIKAHTLIINSTPLGTYPNIELCPPIPYTGIGKNHLLFDLIYNPNETKFLSYGKKANAKTLNGLRMLQLQAEKSWEIWNS